MGELNIHPPQKSEVRDLKPGTSGLGPLGAVRFSFIIWVEHAGMKQPQEHAGMKQPQDAGKKAVPLFFAGMPKDGFKCFSWIS